MSTITVCNECGAPKEPFLGLKGKEIEVKVKAPPGVHYCKECVLEKVKELLGEEKVSFESFMNLSLVTGNFFDKKGR